MAELDVRTAALQSITMTRYVEGFTREMIEGFGEKNAREFLGQALDHLLETAAMLGNVSDRLASNTGEAEPTDTEFEVWLRTVCIKKPPPEAYDLARCAYRHAAGLAAPGAAIAAREQPTDAQIDAWLAEAQQTIFGAPQQARFVVLKALASREEAPDTSPAATPAAPGEVTPEQAFEAHRAKVSPYTTSYPIFLAGWNAALSHPALVEAPGKSHAQLMKFYGVDSMDALVAAQADHITKLQDRLPRNTAFTVQRVREG